MTKRRINHQQSARITTNQQRLQKQLLDESLSDGEEALVISCFGRVALIETSKGSRFRGTIRANVGNLVAGDRVIWLSKGQSKGAIISRCERTSVLVRQDNARSVRPVAANITQIMIVIAAKPEVSWSLLDSYLVMAEQLQIEACIVLNKVDLEHTSVLERLNNDYTPLGYPVIKMHSDNHTYLDALRQRLVDKVSVFVGQSGVGKSSLISQCVPDIKTIQTLPLSIQSELGQHTTSNSCFYHLPSGGALIDSPGIRELVLWNLTPAEKTRAYREFKPIMGLCKFRNCNHMTDLGCAIIDGVKKGLLSPTRYENYVKLLKYKTE